MRDQSKALTLSELQRRMIDTIYGSDPDNALLGAIRARRSLAPESLLAIYRNATQGALFQTLQISYPVIERLIGPAFFKEVASAYLSMVPSHGGDLEQYGASFGDFLDQYDPVAALPYLGDVARLEWLVSRLQRAPVVRALDQAQLAAILPDELAESQFALVPRVALFESRHPAFLIWKENRDHSSEPESISLDEGMDRRLVVVDNDILSRALSEAEWAFFACFIQGASLTTAVEAALLHDEGFDVTAALAYALQSAGLHTVA